VVRRLRIPPIAWVLSGGVAVALLVLATREISAQGHMQFFRDGDSFFYLLTGRDVFGHGDAFVRAAAAQAPYRYGRMGMPFISWVLVLGRPGLVEWSMIGVYLASIAAIPGIAATLLDEYGAPPIGAAFVLLTPGLLLVPGLVYADPLQIAVILIACLLEARHKRGAALGTLAFAVLVKETSALALLPWIWTAWKRRDYRLAGQCAAVLVPYALWATWVRVRVGEFPFLAHTHARVAALSPPGVGFHDALTLRTPNHNFIVTVTILTFVLGLIASWVGRRYWIAGVTFAFTILTACFGRSALYYVLENLRLLALPTVFSILCLVCAWSTRGGSPSPQGTDPGVITTAGSRTGSQRGGRP
jgi:hypothetical protein